MELVCGVFLRSIVERVYAILENCDLDELFCNGVILCGVAIFETNEAKIHAT